MCDKYINILWNCTPELLTLILTVHETPIEKLWGIWRTKYTNTLDLYHLVLEIDTDLF